MSYVYLLTALLVQSPPTVATADLPPPVSRTTDLTGPSPPDYRGWPPNDPDRLALFVAEERRYSFRLGRALGKDLRPHLADYVEHEEDKARERARGDDDSDDAVQSFAVYMDAKYRKRRNLGITIFVTGFAPLGPGLYIGLTLGEGGPAMLAAAGVISGLAVTSGAVVWAVFGTRLRRLRAARRSLEAGGPRVHWRGLTPTWDPRSRSHGLSLGFAF